MEKSIARLKIDLDVATRELERIRVQAISLETREMEQIRLINSIDAEIRSIKRHELERDNLQPCGHPRSAIRGCLTHYCSTCEEENDGQD